MKKVKIFNDKLILIFNKYKTLQFSKIENVSSYDDICDVIENKNKCDIWIDENGILFDISEDNWKQDLESIALLKDVIE